MIISPVFREYSRFWLQQSQRVLSNANTLPLKTALFLLSVMALLAPGMSVRAEIIMGIIESYNPQKREATISLGEQDGVGKYDRGKIELTSLDNPNVRFVGANIVVTSVEKNFAVVSVREAPGVAVPIQPGARISLDTDSGIARREEEAKIIAAQEAEEARRQQQLAAAKAEQARRQRELEEERAAAIRRQQEQAAAQAAEARRQQELEAARAAEARRQQELEQARIAEVRRQQELEQERVAAAQRQQQLESADPLDADNAPIAESKPDLEEAKTLWQGGTAQDAPTSTSDLPLDYLQAYNQAREQPSPETYYRFAQVLIDYELSKEALNWLRETRSRFPRTTAVNELYRAVVLIQQGKIAAGEKILAAANLPEHPLTAEFSSYVATQQGEWEQVLTLTEPESSAATYNNYLIARYCTKPFVFDRDTDLSPKPCPLGAEASQPAATDTTDTDIADDEELDDDEQERIAEAKAEHREELRQIGQQALEQYPEDPYIHNTLGFIALQAEDYELAYKHYEQLAQILDRYDTTPPRLQLLKANAIKYVNNYNQNYQFLADNGADLESLRSTQNSLSDAILIGGAGNAIFSALSSDVSPVGIAGGILATFLRFNQSRSRAKDISQERNSIADQMHTTFTQDIDLVPTPPNLTADSWLQLTANGVRPNQPKVIDAPVNNEPLDLNSDRIEQRMRQFDQFWETAN